MSARLAVRIAMTIVKAIGRATSRVPSPARIRTPPKSSTPATSRAWKPGKGIPSVVKNSVTSGIECSFPQPVPMNTNPTVSRANAGPRNAPLSAVLRALSSAPAMKLGSMIPLPAQITPARPGGYGLSAFLYRGRPSGRRSDHEAGMVQPIGMILAAVLAAPGPAKCPADEALKKELGVAGAAWQMTCAALKETGLAMAALLPPAPPAIGPRLVVAV